MALRMSANPSGREDAEKPFWISFADLMTALMVLFLVAMAVALLAVTKGLDSAQFDVPIRQRSPLKANEYQCGCIGPGFSSVWGPIGKMRKIAGWRNAERWRPPTRMAGEPVSLFGASF